MRVSVLAEDVRACRSGEVKKREEEDGRNRQRKREDGLQRYSRSVSREIACCPTSEHVPRLHTHTHLLDRVILHFA